MHEQLIEKLRAQARVRRQKAHGTHFSEVLKDLFHQEARTLEEAANVIDTLRR